MAGNKTSVAPFLDVIVGARDQFLTLAGAFLLPRNNRVECPVCYVPQQIISRKIGQRWILCVDRRAVFSLKVATTDVHREKRAVKVFIGVSHTLGVVRCGCYLSANPGDTLDAWVVGDTFIGTTITTGSFGLTETAKTVARLDGNGTCVQKLVTVPAYQLEFARASSEWVVVGLTLTIQLWKVWMEDLAYPSVGIKLKKRYTDARLYSRDRRCWMVIIVAAKCVDFVDLEQSFQTGELVIPMTVNLQIGNTGPYYGVDYMWLPNGYLLTLHCAYELHFDQYDPVTNSAVQSETGPYAPKACATALGNEHICVSDVLPGFTSGYEVECTVYHSSCLTAPCCPPVACAWHSEMMPSHLGILPTIDPPNLPPSHSVACAWHSEMMPSHLGILPTIDPPNLPPSHSGCGGVNGETLCIKFMDALSAAKLVLLTAPNMTIAC
ncbi:hypothetical protein Pelo_7748 [Pelomyxa schiedti]|nr:hypothetical protein Pelo_7748 [Pelomyxa schiedti]